LKQKAISSLQTFRDKPSA